MKFFCKILSQICVYFIIFASDALANGDDTHAPGEMHNDAVAIDPLIIIIVPIVLIAGGLILWKFVLHNNKSTPDQLKPKSQEQTVNTQTSSVPEAKKDVNNTPS